MSRTRKQKRAAKLRNRLRRKALLVATGEGRLRYTFFGKARSGDKAALDLTFDGAPLPVDEDRPGESLMEALAVDAWRRDGYRTSGDA